MAEENKMEPVTLKVETEKKTKHKKTKSTKLVHKNHLESLREGFFENNPEKNENIRIPFRSMTPRHVNLESLSAMSGPFVAKQLTQKSVELKFQHELQRALMELQQKEEDFLQSVEITEDLTKENTLLKEKVEELIMNIQELKTDNEILNEKLKVIDTNYIKDLNEYQADLEEHKELVSHLQSQLNVKTQILENKQNIDENMHDSDDEHVSTQKRKHAKSSSIDSQFTLANYQQSDLRTSLEKQLFLQLEESKHKYVETTNRFMSQLEDMQGKNKQHEELKQQHHELQDALKEQLQQQQLIQKTMEQEVVALAARNSSLEHSKEELINLLEQRDHEIEILKTQIDSERKQSNAHVARQQHIMSIASEAGGTLDALQDMQKLNNDDENTDEEEQEVNENCHRIEGLSHESKKKENNSKNNDFDAILEFVLNDESIIKLDEESINNHNSDSSNIINRSNNVFVPDVIKEYLHLTASAVKIKFPRVTTFTSEQLISQVKSLPFFQYHDYMVRIMEKELNNIKMQESLLSVDHSPELTVSKNQEQPPAELKQRKSLLSLFGKFFTNEDEIDNKTSSNNRQTLIDNSNNRQTLIDNLSNSSDKVHDERNYNDDSEDENNKKNKRGFDIHASNRRLKGL